MSGTLIPMSLVPVDPWSPMQKWENVLKTEADRYMTQAQTATERERPAYLRAQTGLLEEQVPYTQAQTGLVKTQTVGEQIKNVLNSYIIQARAAQAAALKEGTGGLSDSTGTSYAPSRAQVQFAPDATGTDVLTGAAKPTTTASATAPATASTSYGAFPTESEGYAPAISPEVDTVLGRLRTASAEAPGASAPVASAPGPTVSALNPNGTSRAGTFLPGVGAIPRHIAGSLELNAWTGSGDQSAAMERVQDMKRTRLAQLAAGASDEASWDANVRQAWTEGLLTNGEMQRNLGRFREQQAVVNSLAKPDTMVSYAQTLAGQGAVPSPTGPVLSPQLMAGREPIHVKAQEIGADGRPTGRMVEATIPRNIWAGTQGGYVAPGTPTVRVESEAPGTDGNRYTVARNVPAQSVQYGQPGGSQPAPTGAGQSMSYDDYDRVMVGAESGGNANAANPRSSAVGQRQFLAGTWLDQVRKQAPEVAQGRSDAELLAMRRDPEFEKRIAQGFAEENAAALEKAGIPVNGASLYMAHFLGPDRIGKITKMRANTPLSALLPEQVMTANPQLQGQTLGSLYHTAVTKFGSRPVDFGGPTVGEMLGVPGSASGGAAAPAGGAAGPIAAPGGGQVLVTPAPPLQTGVGAVGVPEGSIIGNPTLPPEAAAALHLEQAERQSQIDVTRAENEARAKGYGDQAVKVITAGAAAPMKLERLAVLENAASEYFRTGNTGEARLRAQRAMVDAIELVAGKDKVPDWLRKGTTGGEVIAKEGGQLAAEMTRTMDSNAAASVFQEIRNIQPNLNLSTGGFQALVNSIRQGVQRDVALANFQEDWLQRQRDSGVKMPTIEGMQRAFDKSHPIEAYASRVLPYPVPKDVSKMKDNVVYVAPDGTRGVRYNGVMHIIGKDEKPPPA